MATEYLVYGLARDATESWQEDLLGTGLADLAAAEHIIALAKADGFHHFRIAKFKEGKPDFIGTLSKPKKGK